MALTRQVDALATCLDRLRRAAPTPPPAPVPAKSPLRTSGKIGGKSPAKRYSAVSRKRTREEMEGPAAAPLLIASSTAAPLPPTKPGHSTATTTVATAGAVPTIRYSKLSQPAPKQRQSATVRTERATRSRRRPERIRAFSTPIGRGAWKG